jgi:hypothetical protein
VCVLLLPHLRRFYRAGLNSFRVIHVDLCILFVHQYMGANFVIVLTRISIAQGLTNTVCVHKPAFFFTDRKEDCSPSPSSCFCPIHLAYIFQGSLSPGMVPSILMSSVSFADYIHWQSPQYIRAMVQPPVSLAGTVSFYDAGENSNIFVGQDVNRRILASKTCLHSLLLFSKHVMFQVAYKALRLPHRSEDQKRKINQV